MNDSFEAIVKVIAYGVPALLIILGFAAVMGGFTIEAVTGEMGIKRFGYTLIAVGVILYVIELIYYFWSESQ